MYEQWLYCVSLANTSHTDYTPYELFASILTQHGINTATIAYELAEFLSPDELAQVIEVQHLFADEPNLMP